MTHQVDIIKKTVSIGTLESLYRMRHLLILSVLVTGEAMFFYPYITYIKLTFFAQGHGGGDCVLQPSSPPCHAAAADMAYWNGIMGGISNCCSWMIAIAIGSASDAVGRRPFLALNAILSTIPIALVAGHIYWGVTLWLYIAMQVMFETYDSSGVRLAYVGDVITDPQARAPAKASLMVFSIGCGLVLAPLNAITQARVGILVASAVCGVKLIFFFVCFPETVPLNECQNGNDKHKDEHGMKIRRLSSLRGPVGAAQVYLQRPSAFHMLLVVIVSSLWTGGLSAVMMSFLTGDIGFTRQDSLIFFAITGISVGAWSMLVRPVQNRLGEVRVLQLSLTIGTLKTLLLLCCHTHLHVYLLFGALSGPASLQYSVMSAIKTNLVGPDERGLVQGMLVGMTNFSSGIASIAFGIIYSHMGEARVPLLGTSLFGALALALACNLPAKLQHASQGFESLLEGQYRQLAA